MKQKNFFMMLVLAFGVTTFMTAQVPSYVPTNGLVGYWPFNGNANDESGNGNNCLVTGATLSSDRFSNSNKSYYFDDSGDQINNSTIFTSLTNSFSISLWIKCNTFTNSPNIHPETNVLGSVSNWNAFLFHTYTNGGGYCGINTNVSGRFILPSNTFSTSKWTNVIFTFNNGAANLYLDGLNIATSNNMDLPSLPWNGFQIGYNNDGRSTLGTVDDIGIWNRALTEQEVSNLYNANICYQSFTVTDTLIINTGILGYNPITYDNAITMYPNPAKDHLTIDCGTLAKVTGYQIKVTNSLGQEVFKTTLNPLVST